jgi:hypothetical protein
VTVTVTNPDAVSVSGSPSVCQNTAVSLTATQTGTTNTYAYSWSASPAAGSGIPGAPLTGATVPVTPTLPGTYVYTVSASDVTLLCNTTSTFTLTVNPQPGGVTANASSASICSGGSVNLTSFALSNSFPTPNYVEGFETFPLTNWSVLNTAGTFTAAQNTTYFSQGVSSVLFNTASFNADGALQMTSNIDLTALGANPQLTFSHICGLEDNLTAFDFGYVEYSTNGGTNWTTFPASAYAGSGTLVGTGVSFGTKSYPDWMTTFTAATSTPGTGPATALWKQETINLAAFSTSSTFRVRFRTTTDGSVSFYGWLLDNVAISSSPAPSYAWTSAPAGFTSAVQNPTGVTPAATTIYTVTATNNHGCSANAATTVTVNQAPSGISTVATPPNICLGSSSVLSAAACVSNAGFANAYAPASWTTTQTNSNGTVNTAGAPANIVMTSSDGIAGNNPGITSYSHTVNCAGNVTFNWNYTTLDGSQYDYPRYTINGGAPVTFPGFIILPNSGAPQNGTASIPVNAGDVIALQAYSVDNTFGAATITVSNFNAPALDATGLTVNWYSASTGGTSLGTGNYSVTPASAGPVTYYAEVGNTTTGCTNTTRVPVNLTVDPAPSGILTSANPASLCLGSSSVLSAGVCAPNAGFANAYAPASWTTTLTNSNGTVNTAGAPANIVMTSSDGIAGNNPGITSYSHAVSCAGNVTFNWSYTTLDGSQYDYPRYTINGGTPVTFPGFTILPNSGAPQNGTASIPVNAGDVIALQAYSVDNTFGAATITISNFSAPAVDATGLTVNWYSASTGGTSLGTGNYSVTPASAGPVTYYAEVSNTASGCMAAAREPVNLTVNPIPSGIVTVANPAVLCLGASSVLSAGVCAPNAGFANAYDPTTWTTTLTNSNGTVNTAGAPANIVMTSSDGIAGNNPGITSYSHAVTCSGNVTFNWSYTTLDGSQYDYPRYTINGGAAVTFPGFTILPNSGAPQSGTASIPVNAGDVIALQAYSVDNTFGAATITISSFSAPTLDVSGLTVNWYSAPTGGTSLGTGNYSATPAVSGPVTYYAEVNNTASGCAALTRTAVNLTVNPAIAGNTITASQTICSGSNPAPLTGPTPTGGTGTYSYLWEISTTSASAGFASASGTNNTSGYTPGPATANTWYRRTVTSGTCTNTSTAVQITVTAGAVSLPPTGTSATIVQTDGTTNIYSSASCQPIAMIQDAVGGTAPGSTAASVTVDLGVQSVAGQKYLQRHYTITPTVNGPATLTIYATQAEMTAFNAAPGAFPAMPTSGNNADPNKANIRVSKYSGAPFVGPGTLITPTLVNWNGNYWEITFPVTTFSNFYIHTGTLGPLDIELRDISAVNIGKRNRVDWSTVGETNADKFELERSADGENFTYMGTVAAKGQSSIYSYWDENPLTGLNHYRLKMFSKSGEYKYSKKVTAFVKGDGAFVVEAYPNPVSDQLTVKINGRIGNNAAIVLTDVSGKLITQTEVTGPETVVNMGSLAQGMYFIKYFDDDHSQTIKVNKN